jgi:hypothetical protein
MKILIATVLLASLGIGLTGCIVAGPEPVGITVGWHGDQYYDGHRYWAHDDWMHDHPHDRDSRDQHDEHHDDDH